VGIRTVGDLAAVAEDTLVALLGAGAGRHLHALAHNRDPRLVRTGRRRRSIGAQRALGRTPRTPEAIDAALVGLVDRVMRRMRAAGRSGRTVVLRMRFADYTRATRSHTLVRPTARTALVLQTARTLLAGAAPLVRANGLTLIGISVANLDDEHPDQLELPLADDGGASLDAAIDAVRDRFGRAALSRAVLLGVRDETVPLLPD
jgi:DNA polymerase-4